MEKKCKKAKTWRVFILSVTSRDYLKLLTPEDRSEAIKLAFNQMTGSSGSAYAELDLTPAIKKYDVNFMVAFLAMIDSNPNEGRKVNVVGTDGKAMSVFRHTPITPILKQRIIVNTLMSLDLTDDLAEQLGSAIRNHFPDLDLTALLVEKLKAKLKTQADAYKASNALENSKKTALNGVIEALNAVKLPAATAAVTAASASGDAKDAKTNSNTTAAAGSNPTAMYVFHSVFEKIDAALTDKQVINGTKAKDHLNMVKRALTALGYKKIITPALTADHIGADHAATLKAATGLAAAAAGTSNTGSVTHAPMAPPPARIAPPAVVTATGGSTLSNAQPVLHVDATQPLYDAALAKISSTTTHANSGLLP